MRKSIGILLLLVIPVAGILAQAKSRKLPGIINRPSLNLYAPYISFDGNALLFVSDDGEDNALTVFYTSRETDWTEPVVLPKNVNHRLIYLKGFSLNADGQRLYFTSMKTPTVGGYDIMTSERKGAIWTEPENLALPINTKLHEGCASFTPDGNTIYFMRCEKMDQNKADACKLFFSRKKSNGQWDEPKELPPHINTGNSQTPRIMADGETLLFSSNKMASSKGGMDLYVSKLVNGNWSEPTAMEFTNTAQDDQFVSVTALGRYLLRESPSAKKTSELVEYLIPNELRPKGMMKVEGSVTDPNSAPVSAYITVTDLATKSRTYTGRPAKDGTYLLYLMEGTHYEMSFDPEQSNISYFIRQFDLTTEKTPQKERVTVVLSQPKAGDELSMNFVQFKPNSSIMEPWSETELKKLARVIKANPQLKFEIDVTLDGYVQDSTMSEPDLTEILSDTIAMQMNVLDSLGKVVIQDTLVVKQKFHNDRTPAQGQAITEYLIRQGVDPKSVFYAGHVMPATTENVRKSIIKAVARSR